jgi:hypothetical protein
MKEEGTHWIAITVDGEPPHNIPILITTTDEERGWAHPGRRQVAKSQRPRRAVEAVLCRRTTWSLSSVAATESPLALAAVGVRMS